MKKLSIAMLALLAMPLLAEDPRWTSYLDASHLTTQGFNNVAPNHSYWEMTVEPVVSAAACIVKFQTSAVDSGYSDATAIYGTANSVDCTKKRKIRVNTTDAWIRAFAPTWTGMGHVF